MLTVSLQRKDAMYAIIISCLGVGCVAYVIPLATVQTAARYVSMMLMPAAAGRSSAANI
jgi:hypothetical protein